MAFYEFTPNQPQPLNSEDFNVTGSNMVVLAMEAGEMLEEQDDNNTLFLDIEALSYSKVDMPEEDYRVVLEEEVDMVEGNRNVVLPEEDGSTTNIVKKKTLRKPKEDKENIPKKGKKKRGPKKKSKEQLAHSKALRKVRDQNVSVKSFKSLYLNILGNIINNPFLILSGKSILKVIFYFLRWRSSRSYRDSLSRGEEK